MTASTLVETVSLNYEDFSESFLTCSTCLCTYDGGERSPKLLSCSHTVCRSCLERLAVATGAREGGCLRCPICREAVPLPEPGVGALPPSFLVNQLLDLVASRRREVVPKCATHPGAPELLFCESCDHAFCGVCLGDAHADSRHTVVPFSIAVKRMSEILLYKANTFPPLPVQAQLCLNKLDAAVEAVGTEIAQLDQSAEEVTDQVEASFREVQDLLEQRRKTLLAALQALWDGKKGLLQEQLDLIQAERSRLERECGATDGQLEVRNLTKKISDLDSKMGSLGLLAEPRENSYLRYDYGHNGALEDVSRALGVFGRLQTSRTFPPLCTLAVADCPAHLEASAVLRTFDYEGRPRTTGGDPVTVELTECEGEKKQLDVRLTDLGTGEYILAFRPPRVGRYSLAAAVLGRSLQGSPFEFTATDGVDPDVVFGRRGSGDDCFLQPVAAVYGPGGLVYVLDTGNCRIKVLTPELAFVRHLVGVGVEERGGTGLAVSPLEGTLLVCNWKTRRVTEFDAEGTVVHGFTHAELREPTTLAVNSVGDVFVVDSSERCVFVFDRDGTLKKRIDGRVVSSGFNPSAIGVAPDNRVLVAGSTIYVLDSDGKPAGAMFREGRGKGRFSGLCFDAEGRVLAARSDRSKNSVLLFDAVGGALAFTIESRSSRLGRPGGVAALPGSRAAVVDLGNNCVKKYRYQ
ncbi:unnamed protein product [Ixodes persulcatus]